MNDKTIDEKLEALRDKLRGYTSIAIAFSSGVDSTFLLHMAKETIGERAIAITANGYIFSKEEMEDAKKYCYENNIKQVIVELDLKAIKGFCDNPKDRCYICKKSVFSAILEKAKEAGIEYVADGTNIDDLGDYRPGLKALEELKIVSPLKEVGFTKDEIRYVLKRKGLKIWEKPAYACLATRIPYGETISEDKLEQIDFLEVYLRTVGFKQVRVRHHGDVARIEILDKEMGNFLDRELMKNVNEKGKKAGFKFVTLDLGGYKMGNLNG